MKKLNPLNYEKGAWVLHMLRGMIGDVNFFEGIRRYYRLYAGGNVMSGDFQKVMESVSGIALDTFFQQWLYQPGWPEYRISWHWDEAAREVEISVRQMQAAGLFDMPLDIVFSAENLRQVHTLRITDAAHRFRIPLRTKPISVEIDPDGWALKSISAASY